MAKYRILVADGARVGEVEAEPIKLIVQPDFDFIIYRDPGNCYWVVAEVSTGHAVSFRRPTREEAIASAEDRIAKAGDKVRGIVENAAFEFALKVAATF